VPQPPLGRVERRESRWRDDVFNAHELCGCRGCVAGLVLQEVVRSNLSLVLSAGKWNPLREEDGVSRTKVSGYEGTLRVPEERQRKQAECQFELKILKRPCLKGYPKILEICRRVNEIIESIGYVSPLLEKSYITL
jgi:hypothetical protein